MRTTILVGILAMSLLGCLFGRSPSLKATDKLPGDGSFLVFDDGEGLVAVDPSGGAAWRWTPRESPLAAMRDQAPVLLGHRLLARSGLMATLPVPTGGHEPSLSPDMSQLAYTAPGAGSASSVVILDLGGGPSRTLEAQGAQPTWLPDGHIGARGGDQMSGTTLTRQRADGSEREVLVDTGGAGISYMEWSPDGSQVAFSLTLPSGATRIDVVKADGTEGRALIDVRGGAAIRPRWSPDGKRVAALVRQPADAKLVAPNTIYVADPATGESLPLFEVKAEEPSVLGRGAYKGARELVWSPDSRSIGFFAAMEGDCNQNTSGELLCRNDLYVVKADGGVPRKVFSARLPEPRQLAWLP